MSQANVERFPECTEMFNLFGEAPEAFDADDVEGRLGFYDPDVRFEPQQSALQGGYVGRDSVRQWLADVAEHYGPGDLDVADIRGQGDLVLALGRLRVRGRGQRHRDGGACGDRGELPRRAHNPSQGLRRPRS